MWKQIEGYEGLYLINSDGLIFNSATLRILRGNVNSWGYIVVTLTKNGRRKDHKLHRLLGLAFIPNPNDFPLVNHKDGNKLNNSLGNLEWGTYSDNLQHAYDFELRTTSWGKPLKRLSQL